MIERAVGDVARFDIENLISATFTGDAAKALRIVENLKAEGEAMPAIVWQFTDETRAALLTRTYMDQGENVRDAMMHAGVRGLTKPRVFKVSSTATMPGVLKPRSRFARILTGLARALKSKTATAMCARTRVTCRLSRTLIFENLP